MTDERMDRTMTTLTTVTDAVTERAQSVVPMQMQIRGAHLYDKTRRFVTRTNGKRMFVEKPIPPVEDVALADIDLSNPFPSVFMFFLPKLTES